MLFPTNWPVKGQMKSQPETDLFHDKKVVGHLTFGQSGQLVIQSLGNLPTFNIPLNSIVNQMDFPNIVLEHN